jgi:threonine dehydratase
LITFPPLTEHVGASVHLKLETVQETGSFKIRGAANKLLDLTPEQKSRGIVTCSTGNHGLLVAYVARQLGIDAVIYLSERVPRSRVDALKRLDVEVVVHGER